jgi:hypothetical protein
MHLSSLHVLFSYCPTFYFLFVCFSFVYGLFRLRKVMAMKLLNMKPTSIRTDKRGWRIITTLLMVLGMMVINQAAVLAEPSAPEASTQRKSSAAVQMFAAGVQMAPLLPDLLGFTEPKSYLLLLQNNHELRATGGFITAVGRITLENGRVSELVLQDSYDIARHDVDHPLAPEPVKRFMDIKILFLRDANWSPDFPTTARFARSLYMQDAGVQVDGVVTLDLHAVELLVSALAPLNVPGGEVALTGDNVMQQIMNFWDQPLSEATEASQEADAQSDALMTNEAWVLQRKDFIPLIAEAAITRIQSGNFNPLGLIDAVTNALNQRAIQVWMADPNAAAAMAQQGWDGGLRPEADADYVAVVDSNMGYNKVDAVLERQLSHTVTWPNGPTAPAQSTVAVTYRHPLNVVDESCSPWTDYQTLSSYSGMIERCYFGYVRLYVPSGSKLANIQGVEADSISIERGERGTEVFGGYFSVKPGEEHTVTFTYLLPSSITLDNYQLVVQRQAGIAPLPLEITVDDTSFSMSLVDGRMVWPADEATLTVAP